MKKILSLLLVLTVVFALAACGETKTYTVTFDSNGGSAVASQTVEEGKLATEPTAPTYEGYTFLGWYVGETEYDFATAVKSNITLTAKWQENQTPPPDEDVEYTVTFNTDGGSDVAAQTVVENAKATKPADPTKTGYTFLGWYVGETEYDFDTAVTANVTITAKWEILTFTVTFDSAEGSEVAAATVEYGAKVTKPADPTKTGYTFVGWYVGETGWDFDNDTVTADVTLTAVWQEIIPETCTVRFNPAGADAVVPAQTLEVGSLVTKPADPTKAGYTFLGWFDGATAWDFDTMTVSENKTLTAKWEAIVYNVTYNYDNGTENGSEVVNFGGTATAPTAPTKTGYRFLGWFNGETEYDFATVLTADITLTAKWQAIYTVSYTVEGAPYGESATVDAGSLLVAPEAPTKTGYTFDGWYNGETKWNFEADTLTADVTLEARFNINQYTVTFDSAKGSAVAPATVNYNTAVAAPADPTLAGYNFTGWTYNGEAWNFETPITEDITLVATWTKAKDKDGGFITEVVPTNPNN